MPAVAASTIKNGRSPENDHEAFCSACTTTDGVPPAQAPAVLPGHRLKLRAHGRKIVLLCRGGRLPAVLSGGRRFLRHRGRAERQNQKYSQKGHADAAHKPHRAFPLHSKSPCLAAAVQPLPRYVKRLQIHNTCYNLVTF